MITKLQNSHLFFINGEWVPSKGRGLINLVNPAREEVFGTIASASAEDVSDAVTAANIALPSFSRSTKAERLDLLRAIRVIFERRREDFAQALTLQMGAPITLARGAQTWLGGAHLDEAIAGLERIHLEEMRGTTMLYREPIGVAALITPWNWPINQVVTKTAGALAAGCTMVLKPSEVAPLDAMLFAEVLKEAGVPDGVFNLVNGDGPSTGAALCKHPDIDVISFTGSTRAGILIAHMGADSVKRVHQELGGKSANLILDDADLETSVVAGVHNCFSNAGQSCSVSTRMLVPRARMGEAAEIAKAVAEDYLVGDPLQEATTMGPIVNHIQFNQVQRYIQNGIDEGARLVTGGTGRPTGLSRGWFVKPTVFADVDNRMRIAQEEIFGPVLAILPHDGDEDAVRIANDSIYGLGGVVQSNDATRALRVAKQIRSGHVYINHQAGAYAAAPFGGLKQSGNGYEHADYGIEAFLHTKSILGVEA